MPSICPFTRRSSRSPSMAKIWNFELDEPALSEDRLHQAAGTAAFAAAPLA